MGSPILDNNSQLTAEAVTEILRLSSKLACECPRHLVNILHTIREFKSYESTCIVGQPKDVEIHRWLLESANNIDQMLSATISQLARMEGMVDENNVIVPLGSALS